MEELKPCPFCGNTELEVNHASFYVACSKCNAEGPWNEIEDMDEAVCAAIKAWNKRVK